MTNAVAIQGEYSDLKVIKTRSVVQLIVEVPLEKGDELVRMFGLPNPGKPVPVAVARLEVRSSPLEPPRELPPPATPHTARHKWDELSPAQQAGMRCSELGFQHFLREVGDASIHNADQAAHYVRLACGVHSRADLTTNSKARILWNDLERQYRAWLTVPV